jgi:hypothetical protein
MQTRLIMMMTAIVKVPWMRSMILPILASEGNANIARTKEFRPYRPMKKDYKNLARR